MKFPTLLLAALLAALSALAWVTPARGADVSITAANVAPSTSAIYLDSRYPNPIAGEAITAGALVYVDTADSNKVKLSDADSGTAAVRDVDGIAVNNAASGQRVDVVVYDPDLTLGGTTANGTIYVLSATAGGIAPSADITTGWYVAVIGLGLPSNKLFFSAGHGLAEMRTSTAQ